LFVTIASQYGVSSLSRRRALRSTTTLIYAATRWW
jgi:hypothetical protein